MLFAPSSHRRAVRVRQGTHVIGGGGGFTLLELLTAIAVIAILTTIAIGSVRGAKERANIARARGELAALVTALEDFKRMYGDYPVFSVRAVLGTRIG